MQKMSAAQSPIPAGRIVPVILAALLLAWAAGTLWGSQTLSLHSSSVTGNCFSINANLSGFSSIEWEDLQFIVFVVDTTTNESGFAIVPPALPVSSQDLAIYPALNQSSGDVNVTGCLSGFPTTENLEVVFAVHNVQTSEAAVLTTNLSDPTYPSCDEMITMTTMMTIECVELSGH